MANLRYKVALMILLKLFLARIKPMQDSDYLPIEQCANLNETSVESIRAIYHQKKIKGKSKRFKEINGKLLVHKNYQSIFFEDLSKTYYEALLIARTQNKLYTEIANLLNKKHDTIKKYFTRFTFKHIETAEQVLNALNTYIQNNSLVSPDQLEFSDSTEFYPVDCDTKSTIQKLHHYNCDQLQLF